MTSPTMSFSRLCLFLIVTPVSGTAALVHRLEDRGLQAKAAALFVSGALMQAIVLGGRDGAGLSAQFVGLVLGLLLAALFIAVAGFMVSDRWFYVRPLVGSACIAGLLRWLIAGVGFFADGAHLLDSHIALFVLFVGILWALVVGMLLVSGIYECGFGKTIVIVLCAGLVEFLATGLWKVLFG